MDGVIFACASIWILTFLVSRIVRSHERDRELKKYVVEQLIKAHVQKKKIDRLYGRDGEE
jgi:hypothetical protein